MEQHRVDLGEAVKAKDGFVDEGIAEKGGGDRLALAVIGEAGEHGEDAGLGEERGEAVHELGGCWQEAVALTAGERGEDGRSVLGDEGPSCPDIGGRHEYHFLPET